MEYLSGQLYRRIYECLSGAGFCRGDGRNCAEGQDQAGKRHELVFRQSCDGAVPGAGGGFVRVGGLPLVLLIDLSSFVFALLVLLFVLKIPETAAEKTERKSALSGCREGMGYLRGHSDILYIIITMALLNFFSRLTYENILSPMILARSGNSSSALGMVNAAMPRAALWAASWFRPGKSRQTAGN